jgi:aryl-alcohol dehydrogenase-like predicted oxidoreductase
MTLETRPLGRTGTNVTVLGYGALELAGRPRRPSLHRRPKPPVQPGDAGRMLNAVLDAGINIIDTSIDYGRSETYIGRYVSHRRDEFFLASKCGCPFGWRLLRRRPQHDYRPANIRAGLELSLRRLRTDRLDLVQLHYSPSSARLAADDTIATLAQLRTEGKIRFIGVSGMLPNLPDHIALRVFDVFQIPYSAVQREHEDLISAAAAAGAGTLIRGGVARGAVADGNGWQHGPVDLPAGEGQRRWAAAGLDDLLGGMSPLEFMLRFTISHPGLSSTIVGTREPSHLRANLAMAAKGPLPASLYAEAKRRLALPRRLDEIAT